MPFLEDFEDLRTIGSWHLQIHHRHIEPPFVGGFDGLFTVGCRRYVEALDGQPVRNGRQKFDFVIDQKNVNRAFWFHGVLHQHGLKKRLSAGR